MKTILTAASYLKSQNIKYQSSRVLWKNSFIINHKSIIWNKILACTDGKSNIMVMEKVEYTIKYKQYLH